ncbi:protein of unknown function (plasmid) [Rhodovastum atsumiense]|nr:protein of unknown function [Rhodovastum atsumiense]
MAHSRPSESRTRGVLRRLCCRGCYPQLSRIIPWTLVTQPWTLATLYPANLLTSEVIPWTFVTKQID